MNVPGLSGTWQQRLNEFGRRFYGNNYSGSLQQNLDLINRINRQEYNAPAPQPARQPARQSAPSTASDYVSSITGGTKANAAQQFEKILPYQDYINSMLQGNRTGFDTISLEEDNRYRNTLGDLDIAAAQSGGDRFGSYYRTRGQVADELTKARTDRLSNYQNALEDTFNTQYQSLVDQYWKDPNIDTYSTIAATTQSVPNTPLYSAGQQYMIN